LVLAGLSGARRGPLRQRAERRVVVRRAFQEADGAVGVQEAKLGKGVPPPLAPAAPSSPPTLAEELPWARGMTYSQSSIRIPEGSCPEGAVCLPEGECMRQDEEEEDEETRTKMIFTLGPASRSAEVIKKLIKAGMSVARLNFSHGDHASQLELLETVRSAVKECASEGAYRPIAAMLDTKGPEIRTGRTKDGEKVQYTRGSEITITNDYDVLCDSSTLALSFEKFPTLVRVGQAIRIGDGALNIKVTSVEEAAEGRVRGRVLNDAAIGERKNCNIPGVRVDLPLLQEKDKKDLLEFALPHGMDLVALSFVQDAESVREVRSLLEKNCKEGQVPPKLIAKIENGEGLRNFDSILEASDGIMVARGDLGMEIPPEQVFMAQKVMIGRCNLAGKFVITATQMLESMTASPRPTRAEASDVANAVLDGTDCVMCSGETAAGLFPVEAAEIMARICKEAERSMDRVSNYRYISSALEGQKKEPDEGICHASVRLALDTQAKAILALTESGYTARQISKYKPHIPVIAVTPNPAIRRQLAVVRGVLAIESKDVEPFEGSTTLPVIEAALKDAEQAGLVVKGDFVVAVHGAPESRRTGFSNLSKVVTVE